MANPTTLSELQTRLHYLLDADTEVPSSDEDDYTVRTGLLNAGIDSWQRTDGVLWPELYTTNTSNSGDGSDTSYALPANFRFLTGFILTSTGANYEKWTVIPVQEAHTHLGEGSSTRYCWVQGTPGAYTIEFSNAPTNGYTITIPYYKSATHLTTSGTSTETPDPDYLVYFALAELYKADFNLSGYNAARQEAESRMSQMKMHAAALPSYQNNSVPDITVGFGD